MDYREVLRTGIVISQANTVIAVPLEDRVEIHKLALEQTAGTAQTFTLDLFNRHPDDIPPQSHANLFRLCPAQNVSNGSLLVFFLPFLQVGQPAARAPQGATLPVQSTQLWRIYLRFNSVATGTYALLIGYRKRHVGG